MTSIGGNSHVNAHTHGTIQITGGTVHMHGNLITAGNIQITAGNIQIDAEEVNFGPTVILNPVAAAIDSVSLKALESLQQF